VRQRRRQAALFRKRWLAEPSQQVWYVDFMVFPFEISLVRTQPGSRAWLLCGCRRQPQCKPRSISKLELCEPMAPALPVDERRLRHVAVSWAALGQATPASIYASVVTANKAQWCVDNLVRGWPKVAVRCGAAIRPDSAAEEEEEEEERKSVVRSRNVANDGTGRDMRRPAASLTPNA
jgi:hypothetical protein